MTLSCDDLIKICKAQIDYCNSKDDKYSESEQLCTDAYTTAIQFIEDAKKVNIDEKSRSDFIADKCLNAIECSPTSDMFMEAVWRSALLNVWKLSTTDVNDMSSQLREYVKSIIS